MSSSEHSYLSASSESTDQPIATSSGSTDTFDADTLTKTMPPKKKSEPQDNSGPGVVIDEGLIPQKFISMPQSYAQYIDPKLKSDGTNINLWTSSINQTLHVVLAVPRFLSNDNNLRVLPPMVDRAVRNLLINTIDVDLRPLVEDANTSVEVMQVIQKNFERATRLQQLNLTEVLMKWKRADNFMDHFNLFFRTISELEGLGISIPMDLQSLMLQSITPPLVGTTKSAMNKLILAESKKTDLFGPRDVQAIINSLSTDWPEGEGTASNPFQLCWVAGGSHRGWSQGHNAVRGGSQHGHQAAPAPRSGGYLLNVPLGLLYIPIGNVGPNKICNYCKQRGHYKGDCPLKQGHAGGGPSGQKNSEVSGVPAIHLAVPQVEGEGIVDTGATHHDALETLNN